MKKIISDEMIKEKYSEIIEGLVLNYGYSVEKNAILLIKTILECGVNEEDIDTIEYVCIRHMHAVDGDDLYENIIEDIEYSIRLYNERIEEPVDIMCDEDGIIHSVKSR